MLVVLRLPNNIVIVSKTYPSFLNVKEGSTSHLGLLSSGEKKETALLGARNRFAIRLAANQRSRHIVRDGTAWGRRQLLMRQRIKCFIIWFGSLHLLLFLLLIELWNLLSFQINGGNTYSKY